MPTLPDFVTTLKTAPLILTDGSVYERLRRDPSVQFDPYIAQAACVYDPPGVETRHGASLPPYGGAFLLAGIHREYLDVAQRHGLPMLALADTWRASFERIDRSTCRGRRVNQDNVAFLRDVCAPYVAAGMTVFVGGQVGPRGDAYKPEDALDTAAAQAFHMPQIAALAEAEVDVMLAATLPAVCEAHGIALAMAQTQAPYLLSFVIRRDGTVLDGTPLHEAIAQIDASVPRPPAGYYVHCVHPTVLRDGLLFDQIEQRGLLHRLAGFQANTSIRSPEELNDLAELDTTPPDQFAGLMAGLRAQFHIPILGGCCGTDATHIECLASRCTFPS
jgi:homocysteine S-methyltransferase